MSARDPLRASPVLFRFSNIGPVNNAELKLGDLTVIAGRNNTGKTYITYSLYGFLKEWPTWSTAYRAQKNTRTFSPIRAVFEGLQSRGEAIIPVGMEELERQRKILADSVARNFTTQIQDVFSSRRDKFKEAEIQVKFEKDLASYPISPWTASSRLRTIQMSYDESKIVASLHSSKGADQLQLPVRVADVASAYCLFLLRDLFPDPFILSAERFGISLFYKELDFTKSQIIDLLQKYRDKGARNMQLPFLFVDRNTSRYARPVKDNIDFTRDMLDEPRPLSPLADEKLFDDIKNMMEGRYTHKDGDIRFISKARKEGKFNIPLHLASSSARGMSDLYFFLKHLANLGSFLIIDEPESHLDTANQVLFARLLARLVSSGLRVLITTHSDYIIKELNNLIMLDRDFADKVRIMRKLKYGPNDALSPARVRAYIAEAGGLTKCNIGKYGIEMPVFDRTIDDINEAAITLSSRLEQETGA